MTRFLSADRLGAAALIALPLALAGTPLLLDRPVIWFEADQTDIPQPAPRAPSLRWDSMRETFFRPIGRLTHPGRLVRRVGTLFGNDRVAAAANVNALDEVPNSTWFTNRIGLFPLAPADAARGPGDGVGPDPTAPWTVVSAKTEGVTPGFTVRDARGRRFLIKFDPPGYLGTTSTAHVISNRVLFAAGFNVPEDGVVTFHREQLRVGPDVTRRLADGSERPMTEADLDTILAAAGPAPDGTWRALSSRFLAGRPIGPFDWIGRRADDPNDRVDHEDRRELRGLRVISAWLCHFDTKQHNTLDMYVEHAGRHFVRHHLIDFASTLGAGAGGPAPRYCFEYTLDFPAIAGRALSLGLHEDPWRRVERPPDLEEIGYFEAEQFDPTRFKPLQPNAAFANLTDRDGYWAAKIVSAFSDAHLAAIVDAAGYRDPAARDYMVRVLAARRDKIARTWFDRVPPLDFFVPQDAVVRFHDLGAERGTYPGTTARYRARVATVTAARHGATPGPWLPLNGPALALTDAPVAAALDGAPADHYPFIAIDVQVDRGAGWSRSVTAYVARASGRVVGVDR